LGKKGAIASDGKEIVMKPGFRAPVVDVIGAGDAFAASFITSILKGKSLAEALTYGNVAGALAVTTRGNIENLPSQEDIERLLAYHRRETVVFRQL